MHVRKDLAWDYPASRSRVDAFYFNSLIHLRRLEWRWGVVSYG